MKFCLFSAYCKHCSHFPDIESSPVCDECLACPAREETRKPLNYDGDYTVDEYFSYRDISRIVPYLYETKYDYISYDVAKSHYDAGAASADIPGCTSVRSGNFYGRNLDWFYNNQAEFVVHTDHVLGVAGGFKNLTDSFVQTGKFDGSYPILPFQMYDGINDHGVVASTNVVPTSYPSPRSKPRKSQRDHVCTLMLVRYILDNFTSASEAVHYIQDYVEVFHPKSIYGYGYEMHFMVADATDTFALEFINGQTEIIDISNRPVMTNFHLYGVRTDQSGNVYTPETQHGVFNAYDANGIALLGSGLERYNLAVNGAPSADSLVAMRNLMKSLRYTKAYSTSPNPSDPFWYTEFVGNRDLTVKSSVAEYQPVVDIAGQMYLERTREMDTTWQTTHTSIYDISKRELHLMVQEQDTEYVFHI